MPLTVSQRDSFVGRGLEKASLSHPLLRWIVQRERVRMTSEPVWLFVTIWLVKDRLELSCGRGLDRKMFCELVQPDLIPVTADDKPGGADIQLYDRGFRFTPYLVAVNYRGLTVCPRCCDENTLDERGFIHDVVKIYFWGVRVTTMRIGPINRNVESDTALERTDA